MVAFGSAVAAMLPVRAFAALGDDIAAFTGGANVGSEGITLIAPEIAENGNTVPIEVIAPGATAIIVFASGNPVPAVATFNFGPLAASQSAVTRIRLAGTQDVVAIARMPDGTFVQTSQEVKVTIGGCGG
jgi:sulfur-oxidizing protein SoxY